MEEPSLPTKTKIAAQWINLFAGAGAVFSLVAFPVLIYLRSIGKTISVSYFLGSVLGFIIGTFLFWCSFQLMRGKKWAWWVNVIYLSLVCLWEIVAGELSFLSLIIFVPLALLLLDWKNFWRVAT